MEKNKSVKRMDWRQKVLISILGSFIAMVIRKRIREKEYEQEIQNILRKQH